MITFKLFVMECKSLKVSFCWGRLFTALTQHLISELIFNQLFGVSEVSGNLDQASFSGRSVLPLQLFLLIWQTLKHGNITAMM